ncbi:MAG: HAMP domain-containing histidine kinase, partial [Bacteroidetes bacterium]|nr:HAMP domain-containing histidine kinase [Bacteroidota bacterium]
KTPIATIGLASTVLMKEDIYKMPEKLHHYATIINEENEHLKKQVESVLQSSQIESKKIKLNVTAIDMHQLIAEITKNFEPRIKEHEGNLTTKKEATDFMIKGDIVHIKNILFNLLDNGIKYANKIPQIIVHTKNEKNYFVVSIHDNGKGISNDDKKKIFDKFYRVPSGNIHDVKGFGLGLFYVKDMMEQHKGFVSLKSTVDVGSTFSLWFPIIKK